MAEVLIFPMEKVRPAGGTKNESLAEVLIFPGIRIERGEFSLSDRLPPAKSKRKRLASSQFARKQRSRLKSDPKMY